MRRIDFPLRKTRLPRVFLFILPPSKRPVRRQAFSMPPVDTGRSYFFGLKESFKDTVRLKTGFSGVESGSAQK